MLALENPKLIYLFYYKINQPSLHLNLINFIVKDWYDTCKL